MPSDYPEFVTDEDSLAMKLETTPENEIELKKKRKSLREEQPFLVYN